MKATGIVRRIDDCGIITQRGLCRINTGVLLQEASYFRFFKILHPRTYSSMERSLLPAIHPEVAEARSSFAKYLQGKAIYIIGPSDNKTPIPIDAKNRVVIRYAYMGRDKVGGYYKTIPTDVSYYNGMHATTVASMDKPKFLSDLSFAVLKYKLQTPFWDNVSELLQVRYANRTPYTLQHGVSPNNPIAKAVKLADLEHNSDLSRLDVVDEKALKRREKYRQAFCLLNE